MQVICETIPKNGLNFFIIPQAQPTNQTGCEPRLLWRIKLAVRRVSAYECFLGVIIVSLNKWLGKWLGRNLAFPVWLAEWPLMGLYKPFVWFGDSVGGICLPDTPLAVMSYILEDGVS